MDYEGVHVLRKPAKVIRSYRSVIHSAPHRAHAAHATSSCLVCSFHAPCSAVSIHGDAGLSST